MCIYTYKFEKTTASKKIIPNTVCITNQVGVIENLNS